jgi:tetratricopeptide (TPR) repeat protein
MNRPEEALAENKISKDLDPISLSNHADTGNIYYLSHKYDQAITQLKNTLELDPKFPTTYVFLGYVYTAKEMYSEAITAFQKAIKLDKETPSRQIFLGAAYAKAGETKKAQAILKQLRVSNDYVSPGELSILYAALGLRDEAFASLEKAYAEHDLQLQYLAVDPAFDSLRDDSRFKDLLRRLKFQ